MRITINDPDKIHTFLLTNGARVYSTDGNKPASFKKNIDAIKCMDLLTDKGMQARVYQPGLSKDIYVRIL